MSWNGTKWMSWEGGLHLVALTSSNFERPNVFVHLARIVHTPAGSAPAGLVLVQPDPSVPPAVLGFVSPDEAVGRYFGPNIFAGTPFEDVPHVSGRVTLTTELPHRVEATVEVGEHIVTAHLSNIAPAELIHRRPGRARPFWQQGLEAGAGAAALELNGSPLSLDIRQLDYLGGPPVAWSPAGLYVR